MKKQKEISNIKVTYQETDDGYNELRNYDGYFGRLQLIRTLVGLYNDVILGNQYEVQNVDDQDLEALGRKIKKLLKQGETKNAN